MGVDRRQCGTNPPKLIPEATVEGRVGGKDIRERPFQQSTRGRRPKKISGDLLYSYLRTGRGLKESQNARSERRDEPGRDRACQAWGNGRWGELCPVLACASSRDRCCRIAARPRIPIGPLTDEPGLRWGMLRHRQGPPVHLAQGPLHNFNSSARFPARAPWPTASLPELPILPIDARLLVFQLPFARSLVYSRLGPSLAREDDSGQGTRGGQAA